MTHITTSVLEPFISCCVGRRNDYALQLPDGRYTRMGTDLTYEILFWHLEGRQTLGTYVINELVDVAPEHVSVYGLTIEPGTPYAGP